MDNNTIRKRRFKRGRKIFSWELIEKLDAGGNGDVWKVTKPSEGECAMKVLRQIDETTYQRFKSEIHILKSEPIDGVIRLLDSHLPEDVSKEDPPWLVMPLADNFSKYIYGKRALDAVSDFVLLARTLQYLHKKDISHRDIKPENILFHEGRLVLSDFGLVKYPEKISITPRQRAVGAKFTMAPEMRRHADIADGKKADVYSFAKTIWIAISGERKGFDGQYMPNGILGLKNYHKELYLNSLDQLLMASTDNDPDVRPSIENLADELERWLKLNENFQERNLTEWFELQKLLFPLGAPKTASWTNIDSIIAVINEISRARSLNHMFFPNGGGHTITAASKAAESGMLALHVGEKIAELLKPRKLTYESFGVDPSWDYFRLEAEEITPTGVAGAVSSDGISEHLTEIEPGKYVEYYYWDSGEYNGEYLPDFARPVSRFLNGSFVFFCTMSIYNQMRGKIDAYDAIHNKMTEDQFRDLIKTGAEHTSA